MMRNRLKSTLAGLLVACVLAAAGNAGAEARPDLAKLFSDRDVQGCFLLLGPDGTETVSDAASCAEGSLPASTFKMPHTLVALKLGVITTDQTFTWDGRDRKVPSWNRDQTLETAFRNSVVWCYEGIAEQIGRERMADELRTLGYGNADTGGDWPYWLHGNLRVTPRQQVDFLKRLHDGELPFAPEHQALLRRLMMLQDKNGVVLRGKTGWTVDKGRAVGWLVGWVEAPGGPWYYATRVESDTPASTFGPSRFDITSEALRLLQVPQP